MRSVVKSTLRQKMRLFLYGIVPAKKCRNNRSHLQVISGRVQGERERSIHASLSREMITQKQAKSNLYSNQDRKSLEV